MKSFRKEMFAFVITVIFTVIAIQFIWTLLIQFRVGIVSSIILVMMVYAGIVAHRYLKMKESDDDDIYHY